MSYLDCEVTRKKYRAMLKNVWLLSQWQETVFQYPPQPEAEGCKLDAGSCTNGQIHLALVHAMNTCTLMVSYVQKYLSFWNISVVMWCLKHETWETSLRFNRSAWHQVGTDLFCLLSEMNEAYLLSRSCSRTVDTHSHAIYSHELSCSNKMDIASSCLAVRHDYDDTAAHNHVSRGATECCYKVC